MITTLAEFIAAAPGKTGDELYEMFEYQTSPAVVDEIYTYDTYTSFEPVREALNALGHIHNIQSLKDY